MLINYFGPGCLAGIRFSKWVKLLANNGFRISPPYIGKAAYLTVNSVCTSLCYPVEKFKFDKEIESTHPQAPLFIVGNWRSGTTHLHNLLCLDERFASPSLFQTMYPETFLMSEPWWLPMLALMTPRKRFMDNMEQGLKEPHEDEMALAIMCQNSNMLSWAFPRNQEKYDRYLSFEDCTTEERDEWKHSMEHFVRKVTVRYEKPLILKSPNHTARINLIREIWPEAKFLHIKRHPYDVFRSMCHMVDKVQAVWGLQTLKRSEIPSLVIRTYKQLYEAYFAEISSVPENQKCEISYEELTGQPLPTLERIYQEMELQEFETVQPKFVEYTEAKAGYQKNKHREIEESVRERLNTEWSELFDKLGYETQ